MHARLTSCDCRENTVAAFDRSGRLLGRIEAAFHALAASHTSPELQAVQRELAGPLAAHDSAVMMHEAGERTVGRMRVRAI